MENWIGKLRKKARLTAKKITNGEILKLYNYYRETMQSEYVDDKMKNNLIDTYVYITRKYMLQCLLAFHDGIKEAKALNEFLSNSNNAHKHIAEPNKPLEMLGDKEWFEIVFGEFRPLPYWITMPNESIWKEEMFADYKEDEDPDILHIYINMYNLFMRKHLTIKDITDFPFFCDVTDYEIEIISGLKNAYDVDIIQKEN